MNSVTETNDETHPSTVLSPTSSSSTEPQKQISSSSSYKRMAKCNTKEQNNHNNTNDTNEGTKTKKQKTECTTVQPNHFQQQQQQQQQRQTVDDPYYHHHHHHPLLPTFVPSSSFSSFCYKKGNNRANDDRRIHNVDPIRFHQSYDRFRVAYFPNLLPSSLPRNNNDYDNNDSDRLTVNNIPKLFASLSSLDRDSGVVENHHGCKGAGDRGGDGIEPFLQRCCSVVATTDRTNTKTDTTTVDTDSMTTKVRGYCSFIVSNGNKDLFDGLVRSLPVQELPIGIVSGGDGGDDDSGDAGDTEGDNEQKSKTKDKAPSKRIENANHGNGTPLILANSEKQGMGNAHNDSASDIESTPATVVDTITTNTINTSPTASSSSCSFPRTKSNHNNPSRIHHGPCIWFFVGCNQPATTTSSSLSSSQATPTQPLMSPPLEGRPEHTDAVSHDGTWHYQLSGSKTWMIRPTNELIRRALPIIKGGEALGEVVTEDEYRFWKDAASFAFGDTTTGDEEEEEENGDKKNSNNSLSNRAGRMEITCRKGDLLLLDTRLWFHATKLPSSLEPSISYARDVYLSSSSLDNEYDHSKSNGEGEKGGGDGEQGDTTKNGSTMTNLDGLYATDDVPVGTVLFTEETMPDCEMHRCKEKGTHNCEVVELEDGTGAVVSVRDIRSGEFFCVADSEEEDEEEEEEDSGWGEVEEEESSVFD